MDISALSSPLTPSNSLTDNLHNIICSHKDRTNLEHVHHYKKKVSK